VSKVNKAPYRKIVSPEEYQSLSDKVDKGSPKMESCGVLNLGGKYFRILLRTDSYKLKVMWSCNFPQIKYADQVDGTIEIYNGTGDSVRLYDKNLHRMIITNNDYYGCVKFGYRVLCSDLITTKDCVSMHSAAFVVDGKLIVVTGPSGAGKNTTLNYFDDKYEVSFLWDDWGVVSTKGEVHVTNEEQYHMAEPSILNMLPSFNDWSSLVCEERKSKKYMVPLHKLRKTVKNSMATPINIHTLIIVTNEPNYTNVDKVSREYAIEVFSKPSYSYSWECRVPFMNEHLLMSDEELQQLHKQYEELFQNIPNIVVANNTRQLVDKEEFLREVENII